MRDFKHPSLHKSLDLESSFGSAPDSARWWEPEFERRSDAMATNVVEWSEGSLVDIRVRHCFDRSVAFVAERSSFLEICIMGFDIAQQTGLDMVDE
ncbi:unnamed protein product [Rhodiola kirilowii]